MHAFSQVGGGGWESVVKSDYSIPLILQRVAFDAHHGHATASHRDITKTVHALCTREASFN